MARNEDMERRLQNWARWKLGAGARGALGYASVPFTSLLGADRCDFEEARIPTVDCEAEETDRAVMTLPSELRATVEVFYVLGGGMAAKARRLACTEATIRARIARSHPLIQRWLVDESARRRQVREEFERRIEAARR